jgi:cytochrome bd-type quinol oxidase subunit 1
MVYGLFELGAVLVIVGILTAPFWAQGVFAWMTRPFGAPDSDEIDTHDDL